MPDGGPSLAAGEAQRIFSGLLQHDPNNVAALRLLGLCRVRSGDAAGGLEVLARARALAPDEAETLLHYGIALLACGRANEAAALFGQTASLLPEDPAHGEVGDRGGMTRRRLQRPPHRLPRAVDVVLPVAGDAEVHPRLGEERRVFRCACEGCRGLRQSAEREFREAPHVVRLCEIGLPCRGFAGRAPCAGGVAHGEQRAGEIEGRRGGAARRRGARPALAPCSISWP